MIDECENWVKADSISDLEDSFRKKLIGTYIIKDGINLVVYGVKIEDRGIIDNRAILFIHAGTHLSNYPSCILDSKSVSSMSPIFGFDLYVTNIYHGSKLIALAAEIPEEVKSIMDGNNELITIEDIGE
jgi:hypothetical protein